MLASLSERYVDSPEFHEAGAEARIVGPLPVVEYAEKRERGFSSIDFAMMAKPLESPELLRCFRMMNYLKFRAAITPCETEATLWRERVNKVRAVLIETNQRLIVAAIRRSLRSKDKEEYFAEGLRGLVLAVDHYDYTLGFQFSTLAFKVIRQEAARHWHKAKKWANQWQFGETEEGESLVSLIESNEPDPSATAESDDTTGRNSKRVAAMLKTLPEKRRAIVKAFFGIDGAKKRVDEISDEFGHCQKGVYDCVKRSIRSVRRHYLEPEKPKPEQVEKAPNSLRAMRRRLREQLNEEMKGQGS